MNGLLKKCSPFTFTFFFFPLCLPPQPARVSIISGQPQTHSVAQGWNWTPTPSSSTSGVLTLQTSITCLVYAMLGVEPRASCMLGNHISSENIFLGAKFSGEPKEIEGDGNEARIGWGLCGLPQPQVLTPLSNYILVMEIWHSCDSLVMPPCSSQWRWKHVQPSGKLKWMEMDNTERWRAAPQIHTTVSERQFWKSRCNTEIILPKANICF